MSNGNFLALIILLFACVFCGCSKSSEGDHVDYTTPDGKKTSDVGNIGDGKVAYQVRGGKPVPAKATELHQEARAKGASGDYVAAIALLKQASEIAPDWPYPYYDMAFTYLLQGDSTNALNEYRRVDVMAPRGFFTTKTALWTLEREDKGVFPKGTYLTFLSLEWAKPDAKTGIVDRLTTEVPTFAPAWKEKGLLTRQTDQSLAAFEKALSLDPDPETYGTCVLNRAVLLYKSGKAADAKRMVEELAASDSSTLGTKALAKELLKMWK